MSPCPASVPWGCPAAGGHLCRQARVAAAGGGTEETPRLLSSQSCAHFAAGSGQCQHLWCCHRPGMPLSHRGRSRRGGGWAHYLILEPVPASRGSLPWAPQGHCARQCPAVVTSRSCKWSQTGPAPLELPVGLLRVSLALHQGLCGARMRAGSWGSPSPLGCVKGCGRTHLSLSELSHIPAQVLECTGDRGTGGMGVPGKGSWRAAGV